MGVVNRKGLKCRRCGELVEECTYCKGKPGGGHGFAGKLNCSTCQNSGYVCPKREHGGYWK
jgi:hypothetical protein